MTNELLAKELLKNFLENDVIDYVLERATSIINSGGLQKISLKKDDSHWEIDGSVHEDGLQVYSPQISLFLNENNLSYSCNCDNSFSGICDHVTVIAKKMFDSLNTVNETEKTLPTTQGDWRQSFRAFFVPEHEPEAGQYYLIFRLYAEMGRLQVAFFRGRQNKSGLSNVHSEVTLEQLINNPDWCERSPELPIVAKQIGQYSDYYGHKVEVPAGLINWFLGAIQKEYFLFWEDSEKTCRISSRPVQLKISPQFNSESQHLEFIFFLCRQDKKPIEVKDINSVFIGHCPMWLCSQKTFYQLETSLPTAFVRELLTTKPIVSHENISEFLDRVWSRMPATDVYKQDEFLTKIMPIFVPAVYTPKLFLDEEGSLLTLEIQNVYETIHGEFFMPGPNPDFQTGSYAFEGATYLIRRHQEEEQTLIDLLTEMNFQQRSQKLWFLEPEEAVSFLLEAYPGLVEQYRVYGEKNLSRYRVRFSAPVISAELKAEEKDKWFNLDISIEYEGQNVELEKIWKAWSEGKRYVQLKDGSYASLPESWLERLGHKLEALGLDPAKPPKNKFDHFEAPVLDSLLDDFPNVKTDEYWVNLRDKLRSFNEIEQVEPPVGLNADLRAYQLQGVSYLNFLHEYGFGGILADEMGLGKTVQTLSFIQRMVETGHKGPNLIVVPTSVLPNWEREAEKFVPELKRLIIYGAKRGSLIHSIAEYDLVMTTYALLRRDLEELQNFEFNSIILDEAQNIKNPNTITAKSVREINARHRLCLSGTPIENNLFELWSLFEFLMPGFLGAQHAFQRGIVKPIKDGDDQALDFLRTRVRPFILRRTKNEVAKDLPPKIENTYYCALEEEQAELYAILARKLKEQVLNTVEEKGLAKSQMSILDALLRLRQICCHPRLLKLDIPGVSTNLPSGKFEAFKDMIVDIVDEGHKVLVFSQFVQMLHIIRSWLQISEIPFCYLDGSSKDRFEQVDKFNNTPEIPIFLISLKAGGTGLNLTSADYVIHYDPWWNPAVENQATDRAHRLGQTKQVFAYKLICQHTVEEKILKLQDMKRGVADAIIPGQETWKSLTRDDLEMLFEI
ncbi:non-specific serine/threonine protein kinase [Desulfovibrio litoralis DSM 11393]|uniref:Non-specific serine/threonine protein kinase n=2 Tax=Desulfovibrio litoralis TaxID=466107 RepID=A0A1M7T5Z1_9BACT|nr:DEAD/DEAH box helicase [Desulfovibrio litoralis]SHN66117.1 non-specific serine/threonine protein kinase [Desulfovibrio litoralis DSM 11393]